MKLHTDFHDYYDTAIGFGIDDSVHYNRFTKIVEKHFKPKLNFPPANHNKFFLLGFCGEIYPLIEITEYDENHRPKCFYCIYSYEEYFDRLTRTESVIKNIKSELWFQSIKETDKEIKKRLKKWLEKEKIKSFFSDWKKSDDALFLEYKVPVWMLDLDGFNREMILNPKLTELDFERIKNANTAFQEISMYLSNILVEQKETIAVEDKYRIEQHGFDSKISFRKEKQK